MGYTAQQQTRLDTAQRRLDDAKSIYQSAVNNFNSWAGNAIPCYTQETWYGVAFAERGDWKPKRDKCTRAGACNTDAKNKCQNAVDQINGTYIPQLQSAYKERNDAQSNYQQVLEEIKSEVQGDPDLIKDLAQINAEEQADALVRKQKWIFAGVAVLVIGGLILAWWKWGRKAISAS